MTKDRRITGVAFAPQQALQLNLCLSDLELARFYLGGKSATLIYQLCTSAWQIQDSGKSVLHLRSDFGYFLGLSKSLFILSNFETLVTFLSYSVPV